MSTKDEPSTADSAPAVGGPLERGVGRPVPKPYSHEWFIERAREAGRTLDAIDAALGVPGISRMVASARLPVMPRGCHECAWGKVAGCWRCGSR